MIQNFVEDYNSPVPIVRFYFRKVILAVIDMLYGISEDSLILDFGCGSQYLKTVSNFKIIGYDIIPEFSDVTEYRNLSPDVIVCNHSLEHLDVIELRETLNNFKEMNPKFMITGIPTENLISRLCAKIGRPHGYFEHKTKMQTIHDELNKRFVCVKRKNIITLTIISKWK